MTIKHPDANVGDLRTQSAFTNAATPIVLASKDPEVARLVADLRVVRVYPDTTDAHGQWASVFKIEVALVAVAEANRSG